jgi:hypothetical protein
MAATELTKTTYLLFMHRSEQAELKIRWYGRGASVGQRLKTSRHRAGRGQTLNDAPRDATKFLRFMDLLPPGARSESAGRYRLLAMTM